MFGYLIRFGEIGQAKKFSAPPYTDKIINKILESCYATLRNVMLKSYCFKLHNGEKNKISLFIKMF